MKRPSVLLLSAVVALFVGCSQMSPVSSDGPVSNGSTGEVQLLVNVGQIGALGKSLAITLDSLTLDLTATGEAAVHRMIPISGSSQQTVNLTLELACKKWTINVSTWDGARSYNSVHSASDTFTVVEGVNPTKTISMDARYSMLTVRVNPIPDSAAYIGLYSDTNKQYMYNLYDDTTFAKGAKPATDTAKLYYDWLSVSMPGPMGGQQYLQAIIRGYWGGQQLIDLYYGNLVIPTVVAGANASYSFNLNWIGPSNTTAQKSIAVTIGQIGMITVDGKPITPAP